MLWEAISNTRKSVSRDIQTLKLVKKKLGCASFFQPASQCLDTWWNTLPRVWYITSNIWMMFYVIKTFIGAQIGRDQFSSTVPRHLSLSWLLPGRETRPRTRLLPFFFLIKVDSKCNAFFENILKYSRDPLISTLISWTYLPHPFRLLNWKTLHDNSIVTKSFVGPVISCVRKNFTLYSPNNQD